MSGHRPPVTPDPWQRLKRATPARLALGRAGAALPLREVLQLGLAHAQARDAVHATLDADTIEAALHALALRPVRCESAAPDRATYLRRPDFGRRLSRRSVAALKPLRGAGCDIAIVLADGLSATAVDRNAAGLLGHLVPALRAHGRSLGPVAVATQARVALGDGIGEILGARLALVLIGERPGLSSPDSLGAYLTHRPRVGRTDAMRNCVSNIRPAGLPWDRASATLSWLVERALALSLTGVGLKDDSTAAGEARRTLPP